MLILAFDTSSKTASVSVLRNNVVLHDVVIDKDLNHSEVLLPAIDEACRNTNVRLSDIDLFACTLGPGSFTGLRISVSTLKGIMMATGKPAAGVSSLMALALNVEQNDKVIGSMMDAGRGQVYLAYYRYDHNGVLRQFETEQAIDPECLDDRFEDPVIYVGDGAVKYAEVITSLSKRSPVIAPEQHQFIRASAVGRLAKEKFLNNDLLDLAGCVPVYLRSADARPPKKIFS